MSPNEKKQPDIRIDIEIDNKKNAAILDELTAAEQTTELARTKANKASASVRKSAPKVGTLHQDSTIDKNANRDDRLIALLCYVFPLIMSAIVLISESSKGRPFQRYHAVQGLGLAAGLGILGFTVGIFASMIMAIPVIGWLIGMMLFCLSPIGFAMGVLAHLYYGYQAYQGKRFAIPGVARFLRGKGWL